MVIDKMVPTSALRTGTAPREVPGSSASRMPSEAVRGAPLLDSQANHPPPRDAAARRFPPSRVPELNRHVGTATAAIRTTTMQTKPRPNTAPSTSMPGLGSATRAGPSGMIGDARTAPTSASNAPTAAMAATCITLTHHNCR